MNNSAFVLVFAFLVSIANVGLNFFVAHTASSAKGWGAMFTSTNFVLAFLLGIGSLSFMSMFYYFGRGNQIGMANGVLLMGATSIIAGTLLGYFGQGARVHWSEWCIFALLIVFIFLRYVKSPVFSQS